MSPCVLSSSGKAREPVLKYDLSSVSSMPPMVDRRVIFEFFTGEESVFGDGSIGIAGFPGLAPEHDEQQNVKGG